MDDSAPDLPSAGSHTDTRYVLRLIVVKVEGVLVPSPREWDWGPLEDPGGFTPDGLFPDWSEDVGLSPDGLRNRLGRLARESPPAVPPELRSFLDGVRNHTPLRVGFLSGGPTEWVEGLEEELDLDGLRDLTFCYDDYPHGTRRTLLQFLMNRFIAGKGRTLLLGDTMEDERLAVREETRFRSLEPPPDASSSPEHWDRSLEELESFVEEVGAEG